MSLNTKAIRIILWLFFGVAAIVGGTVFGAILIGLGNRRVQEPTRESESTQQKYDEASKAFSQLAVASPANAVEAEVEIRAFFDNFGKLASAADRRIVDKFDFEMMLEAANQQGLTTSFSRRQSEAFVKGMKIGARQKFGPQMQKLGWETVNIHSVRFLKGTDEALVFVRHRDSDGLQSKIRWWLIRRDGIWRIYDFEDLDVCLRCSVLISTAMQGNNVATWTASYQSILRASNFLLAEDWDSADRALKKVDVDALPPPIKALYFMLLASIRLGQENPADALAEIDLAERANPDMPILHYQRAYAFAALGENEKALENAAKYEALLGADADVYCIRGDALLALGRREEALESYRKGVVDDAESTDNIYGLATTEAGDVGSIIMPLLEKTKVPADQFNSIASMLYDDSNLTALESLIKAYRAVTSEDVNADFYEAYLHYAGKRYEQAATMLEGAIPRVKDDEERATFIEWYQQNMARSGHSLEAYEKAKDQVSAFDFLARCVINDDKTKSLRALVDAHQARHADDPWLAYYSAYCLGLEGNFQAAAEALERTMSTWDDDEHRGAYLQGLYLESMAKVGRAVEAYGKVANPGEVFIEMADDLSDDAKDVEQLRALVDAHEVKNPADLWLAYYRGIAHRLVGEHEQANEVFADGMAQTLDEEQQEAYRLAWVSARLEAGQGLDAYQRIGPKDKTFLQLCSRYSWAKDAKSLRQLLDAHKPNCNDPKILKPWEAEAAFLEGSFEQAVENFDSLSPQELEAEYGEWRAADRVIRSLAHLKRDEEALKRVDRQAGDIYQPLWRALIHALVDRHDQSILQLEIALRTGDWQSEEFYDDEHLGPLLQTPPYESFRKDHPRTSEHND